MGSQARSRHLGQGPEGGSPGHWAEPAPLTTEPGRSGKGGVPVREAVCDPHCPLTEKGRVKRTLGAEPLSPGALASRATLTKGRRRGGGGGGDRGRLFSRRSAGAKRGLGSRGPGAPCSCEGGASRPASWGPLQQGAAPAPGPLSPPTPHPARPPPLSPARLALGPALLQPDTAPLPQCHLFQVQPPPRFQEGREFGEDALYPARLEVT